jgi:hypothetical protein
MNTRRIVLLILFLLAGLASLLYGAMFHAVSVQEEKEREISIAIPTLPGLGDMPFQQGGNAEARPSEENTVPSGDVDPFRTPPGGGVSAGNPFDSPAPPGPPPPPGMRFEKVTEKYLETSEEPEWSMVWEVTIGGVVRLANGQLKRTYSGQPPALCPT